MCDAEKAPKPEEDFGKFNTVQSRIIPLMVYPKHNSKKSKQQMHAFYISHRSQMHLK